MINEEKMFSENDYLVLKALYDNDCTTEMRSWTIRFIAEQMKLSQSKIRKTVLTFLYFNYLKQGVMKHNAKTYFITQDGIERLKELKVV